jgi:hypothetical protein
MAQSKILNVSFTLRVTCSAPSANAAGEAAASGLRSLRMFKKGQFKLWIDAVGGGTKARFINRLFGLYV